MKKILLFSISKHTGHFKAAKSIESALTAVDPACEILSIDAMHFFHPVSSQIIDKMYYFSIKNAPFLWGGIYDSNRVKKTLTPVQKFIHHVNYAKLNELIIRFDPDAVICTQAFPCGMLAHYKRKTGTKIPLIGVVTDFWPHRFWFYKEVDCYTIASQWAARRFAEFGIEISKIKTLGIPIHPNFMKDIDKYAACRDLGLSTDVPVVLVMGGSTGHGPIEDVVHYLDRAGLKIQIVVICGKNEKLYESLTTVNFVTRVKVLGCTDEVYKIMSASDFIVSKTGGITTAEVLAKKKIMIALPSIPGQEIFNMKYLLRNGMALRAKKAEDVAEKLKILIDDDVKVSRMLARIEKVSSPSSSVHIARLVLGMAE